MLSQALESKLNGILKESRQTPNGDLAQVYRRLDREFGLWLTGNSPAARHSVGWPAGPLGKERFAKATDAERAILIRVEELLRIQKSDQLGDQKSQVIGELCQKIADRIRARILGLSPLNQKRIDGSSENIDSVGKLACFVALAHTTTAHQQLANTPVFKEVDSKVRNVITTLEKRVANIDAQDRPDSLSWTTQLSRAYQLRTVNRDQEQRLRSKIEGWLMEHPPLRRYLAARQARKITKERLELAEVSAAPKEMLAKLQASNHVAEALERVYRKRCGSDRDRNLQRIIQAAELHQDSVRRLQEQLDADSLSVSTYSLRLQAVAAEHFAFAADSVRALGPMELVGAMEMLRDRVKR